ncbi:MAG: endoproteinase ArgC [Proteobacteria bacterium]|nr:endoproteinase ArgC [Pseudomonadota bacterium]
MQLAKFMLPALPVVLALTACGGGGSNSSSSSDSGSGSPIAPVWTDRIEPFAPKAAPAPKRAASADGPTGAVASAAATPLIALGTLPASLAPATAASDAGGVPRQIGRARALPETASVAATARLLQWQATARGTQVAALRFASQGARGLRLGVLVEALPPGAVLRFYGATPEAAVQRSAEELQTVAERNAGAGASSELARTYWSPDFGSDQVTLELELPAGATPDAVRLAVPRLSHFTQTAAEAEAEAAFTAKAAAVGSCMVDVSCQPDYLEQSRSVARMLFVAEDGNAFYCTGTLLNDKASSGTPYFLSAQHCITSQAVASTLQTDWFYRSASCGSAAANPATRSLTGGATLLYGAGSTDVAFMRLHDSPPAGIVYAGSYYGGVPVDTSLAALHQPEGGLLKLSLGWLKNYSNCSDSSCSTGSSDAGDYMALSWQQGSTEQGSSGSGVFVTIGAQRYLTGQLHGGTASCANPGGTDYFGRFDRSYRAALKKWLNP